MKRALVTGITGQDGSYLAELLLARGYEVHGLIRRTSSFGTGRLEHLYRDPHEDPNDLHLHYGDVTDGACLADLLRKVQPDEVYNLAAQSHVKVSFANPLHTADVVALGTLRLLEAIRGLGRPPRFFQAASSEMFGNAAGAPQDESTPFRPQSPYACAKVFAYWQTVNYREAYGLFACNGVLFNHESPRRGMTFVTRKITRAAARIRLGLQRHLVLGNLDARRDWGYAGDYVDAMWRMLQAERPDDYVVATGETHSVRDVVGLTFAMLDLDPEQHVRVDPCYFRPTDVHALQGDARKARTVLGWEPRVRFRELIERMVRADLAEAERERALVGRGLPMASGSEVELH